MKKITISRSEILEIAKIIKDCLPNFKVFLSCQGTKIILVFPANVNRLIIEELKTLFKIKYPSYQIIFRFQ